MNFKIPILPQVCLFSIEVNIQILLYLKVALLHRANTDFTVLVRLSKFTR